MSLKIGFGSLALVASLVAGAAGCMVEAHGHVAAPAPVAVVEVDEDPPPPRYETVEVRPGFVFIQGHWVSNGGRWVWRGGYYERERVGYTWEQGRWENRGRRRVWVEGGWRGGGRAAPAERDHRSGEGGVIVRDHR